eukprot:NODE_6686_length_440_cov_23.708440_g5109_i0.p3 GENE.NODE_6686_length_440_cov_23.708440_g5109_i0~~NODE_6686_length_440_cov_23.708440_g5109_i0.p3  ORF type:complete len:71 (+),score=2.82 NODE_6686_length_440_cov_23.708440_g5109_i0:60-272(+)
MICIAGSARFTFFWWFGPCGSVVQNAKHSAEFCVLDSAECFAFWTRPSLPQGIFFREKKLVSQIFFGKKK